MKTEDFKKLYKNLEELRDLFSESDRKGNYQVNNLDQLGYDGFWETIDELKDFLEKIVGRCELNDIKEVKFV